MKDLKDTLNESLDPTYVINEAKLKAEGPYTEGDTQYISVGITDRNVGLYTCYDKFVGVVDVIKSKNIEAYMRDNGYSEEDINEVTSLKPGYCYEKGDEITWTCLEQD